MKKSEKEETIAIALDTVRKLTKLAECLEGQTVVVVKRLPVQKSMTAFLTEYARTGRVNVACGLAGLPKTTFYRYQRRAAWSAAWRPTSQLRKRTICQ